MREFSSREELIEHYKEVQERMLSAAYAPPPQPERAPRPKRVPLPSSLDLQLQEAAEKLRHLPVHRIKRIIRETERRHGLEPGSITSSDQSRACYTARDEAIAEAWLTVPVQSLNWLGRLFNRDHTTIVHSLRKLGLKQGNLAMDGRLEKERDYSGSNSSSKEQQHVREDDRQEAVPPRITRHDLPGLDLGDGL